MSLTGVYHHLIKIVNKTAEKDSVNIWYDFDMGNRHDVAILVGAMSEGEGIVPIQFTISRDGGNDYNKIYVVITFGDKKKALPSYRTQSGNRSSTVRKHPSVLMYTPWLMLSRATMRVFLPTVCCE